MPTSRHEACISSPGLQLDGTTTTKTSLDLIAAETPRTTEVEDFTKLAHCQRGPEREFPSREASIQQPCGLHKSSKKKESPSQASRQIQLVRTGWFPCFVRNPEFKHIPLVVCTPARLIELMMQRLPFFATRNARDILQDIRCLAMLTSIRVPQVFRV